MPGSSISSIITRKPVLVGHEMIHELILARKAMVCEASWTEGEMTQVRRGCLVNIPYVACQVAFVLVCPFAFVMETAMAIVLLRTWHVATNAAGRPSRLRLI
jgi:hypothetical protein